MPIITIAVIIVIMLTGIQIVSGIIVIIPVMIIAVRKAMIVTTAKHSKRRPLENIVISCARVCVCVAIIVIVTKAIQAAAAVDSHKSIYSMKSTLVAHL